MSDAVLKLKPLLDALTDDERAEVLDYLADDPDEFDGAFIDEINRRIADLDSGRVKGVPADEFMQRMKEKYG